ncbi:MAG TPA: SHOCT domain-containing protein [Candidatus Limnocylindrales bacterium]|nr:SHOCT domain-containing protein [Candidatus Limnocylindrales bacterium]
MFGNLFDFFWTMLIIFFWVTAFMIWFQCFFDAWRRTDIGGGMKAVWTIVLIALPWVGALIYLIARPKVTAGDVQTLVRAEAAQKAASGVSTADELQKLASLKEAGVIDEKQFTELKAKLLA